MVVLIAIMASGFCGFAFGFFGHDWVMGKAPRKSNGQRKRNVLPQPERER